MKRTRSLDWKKTLSATTAFGIVMAPLATSLTAQAGPLSNAPAYGYRNKDKQDKHNRYGNDRDDSDDRGYDNDDNDNSGYDNSGYVNSQETAFGQLTLTGRVVHYDGADRFRLSTDNGRIVVVDLQGHVPGHLKVGDRVQVRGFYGRNDFVANTFQNLSYGSGGNNNGGTGQQQQTFTGRVVRDWQGDQFELRTDDGRQMTIDSQNHEPGSLSVGDRVQVRGYFGPHYFVANRIRVLRDVNDGNNGNNGNGGATQVSFDAKVLSVQSPYRFTVRGLNGGTYNIESRDRMPASLNQGDRVHITGYRTAGDSSTIIARQVRLTSDNGGSGSQSNDRQTFTGVVTQDLTGRDFEVLADNGNTYRVQASNSEPNRLSRGDKVRLTGYFNNVGLRRTFIAERIEFLRDTTDGINRTFVTGRVTRDLSGDRFEMRADNGKIYTVDSRNNEPSRLSKGDRVQVFGFASNGVFYASQVRLLNNTNAGGGVDGVNPVNFSATVLNVESPFRFTARGDNGHTYTVESRDRLGSSVNRGDRVRVVGYVDNGIVIARQVQLTNDNGNLRRGSDVQNAKSVDFQGTVRSVSRYNMLFVRGDNGREYSVQTSNADSFRKGERVRVVGTFSNGIVRDASVRRY